jgi:hypothetical protein
VIAQLDYYNLIGSVTVSPRIAFSQDLAGVTPLPLGTYVGDRKAISLGVNANWQSRWSGGVEYVRYFGAGGANALRDRDYVTLLARWSF